MKKSITVLVYSIIGAVLLCVRYGVAGAVTIVLVIPAIALAILAPFWLAMLVISAIWNKSWKAAWADFNPLVVIRECFLS